MRAWDKILTTQDMNRKYFLAIARCVFKYNIAENIPLEILRWLHKQIETQNVTVWNPLNATKFGKGCICHPWCWFAYAYVVIMNHT